MRVPRTELDRLLPNWDFRELHQRTVSGTPADAYAAFRALRIREMPVSRVLFAIRSLPALVSRRGRLPTGSRAPLLDLMLEAGFTLLADVPGEEIVVGTVHGAVDGPAGRGALSRRLSSTAAAVGADAFLGFAQPGAVKMAMTFRFAASAPNRTVVTTETRVLATDRSTRRRFRLYWLGIRAFSGLIRREWLAAVARRTVAAAG